MKIIYCICEIYNPGGMERVLLNKVRYLVEQMGYDVTVVTTDQHGRPPFYPFPKGVRLVDLDINYADDNNKGVFAKIAGYLRKKRIHRRRLTELLMREKADVVVSLFPSESSFIPDIEDGSKKVLELHFNKFFRLQYNRTGLLGLIDRWRSRSDEKLVRRFDRFVVLTHEDKGYWGVMPNICVIPNAALPAEPGRYDVASKRIIAVGRLDYQKGFDRLIEAWRIVRRHDAFEQWRLDIFGQGEWKSMLQGMVEKYGLQESLRINEPTKTIGQEYARSAMLVMSSHYEGFPMVMIEAMSAGLPVVSFDYKCGPRDVIVNGVNGMIAESDNIEALANAMMALMSDDTLRATMSDNARAVTATYSEESVMKLWIDLFNEIVG